MVRFAPRWLLLTGWLTSLGRPTLGVAQLPAAPLAWDLPTTLAALDSTNGVGPIRFGMALAQVPLVLTEGKATNTALVGCRAGRVALVLQGIRLYGGFVLVAYRGHVAQLNLGVSTEAEAEALLAAVQARYGPGQRVGYQTFQWVGQVVTLRYVPVLGQHTPTVYGSLYLLNNALAAQQQAAEKEGHRSKRR